MNVCATGKQKQEKAGDAVSIPLTSDDSGSRVTLIWSSDRVVALIM